MVRRLEGLRLHRAGQRHAGRAAAHHLPAPRRLPGRPRRRAHRRRGDAAPARPAGVSHRLSRRVERDPPLRAADAAHPCRGRADERARAGDRQMVQPSARLRLPHPRRGHAGHLRPHGDAAPLRHRRAQARRTRAGALRRRRQGPDGRRGAARRRHLARLALTSLMRAVLRALLALPALALLLVSSAVDAQQFEPLAIVTASARHAFMVEVARDDATRAQGLMYRRSLSPDRGMLFDFKRVEPVSMWMQNTYVSLDMLFIRPDGTIARVAQNTEPLSTRTIPSREPALAVLEVVAGTAARLGIKAGDRVEHPLFTGL